MRSKASQGTVQQEQFKSVTVEPPANQEAWEAGRQEEQGADMPLVGHRERERSVVTTLMNLRFFKDLKIK